MTINTFTSETEIWVEWCHTRVSVKACVSRNFSTRKWNCSHRASWPITETKDFSLSWMSAVFLCDDYLCVQSFISSINIFFFFLPCKPPYLVMQPLRDYSQTWREDSINIGNVQNRTKPGDSLSISHKTWATSILLRIALAQHQSPFTTFLKQSQVISPVFKYKL